MASHEILGGKDPRTAEAPSYHESRVRKVR